MGEESGLQGWHRFIGSWKTEGAHPMLPGEAIRGTSTFEWLDGQRFVIWRSHYDHSQIPDAITIVGVTDGQLQAERGTGLRSASANPAASASRRQSIAARSRHLAGVAEPMIRGRTIGGIRRQSARSVSETT